MSIVCCKEFKGWCKSFTRTETYLSVLQLLFLVVLIASLTFVILHFLACYKNKMIHKNEQIIKTSTESSTLIEKEVVLDTTLTEKHMTSLTPLPKEIDCTWKPSVKTTAVTHYYDTDLMSITTVRHQPSAELVKSDKYTKFVSKELKSSLEPWILAEPSIDDNIEVYDGNEANDVKKGFLLALVKIKPPQDITFGCIVTIVAHSWTLTAASCIEAIEEVDSLDSFVMMRGFGEKDEGSIHAVSDILIHPQYQGVNITYDLAALKSEDIVVKEKSQIATLPTMLDYLAVTIGENLSILGYGKYRNLDKDPRTRNVREVSVYSLPSQQCPEGEGGAWAPRHLTGGRSETRGDCAAGPLCAGVLRARTRPCHYCAGAPLLRHYLLLGIMSDNPHCGLACDPALYVNLALHRDWIDSVIYPD